MVASGRADLQPMIRCGPPAAAANRVTMVPGSPGSATTWNDTFCPATTARLERGASIHTRCKVLVVVWFGSTLWQYIAASETG